MESCNSNQLIGMALCKPVNDDECGAYICEYEIRGMTFCIIADKKYGHKMGIDHKELMLHLHASLQLHIMYL